MGKQEWTNESMNEGRNWKVTGKRESEKEEGWVERWKKARRKEEMKWGRKEMDWNKERQNENKIARQECPNTMKER